MTPWIQVMGGKVMGMPLVRVELRRVGGELKGVRVEVRAAPNKGGVGGGRVLGRWAGTRTMTGGEGGRTSCGGMAGGWNRGHEQGGKKGAVQGRERGAERAGGGSRSVGMHIMARRTGGDSSWRLRACFSSP